MLNHLVAGLHKAPREELAKGAEAHEPDCELLGFGEPRLGFVLEVEGHRRIQRSDVHCGGRTTAVSPKHCRFSLQLGTP